MRNKSTYQQFKQRFPDEDSCLDFLLFDDLVNRTRFCARCSMQQKFYRTNGRKCFECGICRQQVYPMVGTPFRGTKLPLDSLFYIVNQFSNTSQSINSKRFMDALGTGYKTGLSYGHKLRELMPQGTIEGFSGEGCIIEMDETWIGGVNKRGGIKSKSDDRICVFGMRNRETGLVKAFVIKAASRENIIPIILREIKPGTEIHTDESAIYKAPIISKLYKHKFITHKRHKDINGNLMQRRFRVDNVTTNGMESFWSLLKRTLSGVHISVSEKHLQLYVDERVFRQNWKKRRELIFDELLSRIRASSGAPL